VVDYRNFRNTDPPHLVELWNASFPGRGAVTLRGSNLLERHVFAKPFFDPNGIVIAEENQRVVGYGHFGRCQAEGSDMQGVTCALAVLPSHRRRGIGTQLLYRGEEYLLQQGAKQMLAGGHGAQSPFYAGIYGGSDSPGFLRSDPAAEPFFRRHRYNVRDVILVLQRKLETPLKTPDPRFCALRDRYDIIMGSPRTLGGWWEECTIGCLEPIEFVVEDRQKQEFVGRALIWEMEGFSQRWGKPSIGILNFWIREDYRGQGLGKLLMTQVLRQIQEQFFEVAEIQIAEKNNVALSLLRGLGFETVDRGQIFTKSVSVEVAPVAKNPTPKA
jgi:ribosomal protein S18 acetylase RimI-like enzyme